MKPKHFIPILIICLLTTGCISKQVINLSDTFEQDAAAIKHFAVISAKTWQLGSGIIQGALPGDSLPGWVLTELNKIGEWFDTNETLTDFQLGYMVGIRFRMAGPIIKTAIQHYAPGILQVAEVVAVLSFIGL